MRAAIAIAVMVAIASPALAAPDAGSWALDGGDEGPGALPVFDAVVTIELVDGGHGPTIPVTGGCWLSEKNCIGFAGELADKRARVEYLEAHSADAPTAWLFAAFTTGAAAGALGAWCATEPGHCNPFR